MADKKTETTRDPDDATDALVRLVREWRGQAEVYEACAEELELALDLPHQSVLSPSNAMVSLGR